MAAYGRLGDGLIFNERPARNVSQIEKLQPKVNTKADICSSAGTVADSELQPIIIPSASLLPNLLL
jgi:hypothetical protein